MPLKELSRDSGAILTAYTAPETSRESNRHGTISSARSYGKGWTNRELNTARWPNMRMAGVSQGLSMSCSMDVRCR